MRKLLISATCLLLSVTGMYAQRVLYMGDSVTDGGWGRSGGSAAASEQRNHSDLNHIYGHSYMMLCASHYEASYPEKNLVFLNRGISGDDMDRLEARWEKDVIYNRPDVLSLLIGTNDVHYWLRDSKEPFALDEWEQRYRRLLDRTRDVNPDVRFVLCTPFVAKVGSVGAASDYALREKTIAEVDERVCRIAKDYDAVVLRFDSLFRDLQSSHPDVAMSHWIWDGIHPTAAGHKMMADLWIKESGKLLNVKGGR